jgi:CHAT domain-containing protein
MFMGYRFALISILLFFCHISLGQNFNEVNKDGQYSELLKSLDNHIKNNNQDSIIVISEHLKSFLDVNKYDDLPKVISLNEIMVGSYRSKSKFEKASILTLENLELLKNMNDTLSDKYSSNLINLGSVQTEFNQYSEAKISFRSAEKLLKNNNDSTSVSYIEMLAGIGLVENYFSNYKEAIKYLTKADNLIENFIRNNRETPNLFYVDNLINLALAYEGLADFESGLKINLKAKKYLEDFKINNTYYYYLNQFNISVTYLKLFKIFEAEKILLDGLKAVSELNLGNHLKTKYSEGLSVVYYTLGDSTKSEYYNKLASKSDVFNAKNVSQYSAKIQKGNLLQSNGNFFEAYEIFKFIIDEINRLGLPKGKEYLMSLNAVFSLSGMIEKPLLTLKERTEILLESMKLTQKLYGYVSNEYASVQQNIGWYYYYDMFDYKKSVESYKVAINILEAIPESSRNRIALINNYKNISNAYEKINDYNLAYSSLLQAFLLRYKLINEQLPFISETERDKFVLDNQEENSRIKSFVWRNYKNLDSNKYITDLLILDEYIGGLSFNYTIKIRKLLETFPKEVRSQYLTYLDQDLTEFNVKSNNSLEINSTENNDKRELIKLITKQISEFKIEDTYSKIINKTNFDGALVLFQRFKYDGLANTNIYSCVIISKDRTVVKYLPLFQESTLDSNLIYLRKTDNDLVNSINKFYSKSNKSQFSIFMAELVKQLKGFEKIVIIPSGKLNFINFGAIELENGNLFSDNHDIKYFNSLSDFLIDDKKDSNLKFDEIDIFAGLNYNIKPNNSNIQNISTNKYQTSINHFNYFSTSLRSFNNTWNYLPGSKSEGSSIKKVLEESHNPSYRVKLFEDRFGDESSFRALFEDKSTSKVIHLATHGFFFDKLEYQMLSKTSSNSNNGNNAFRSGIILSGGNLGWKDFNSNKFKDDGILTSYEISKLDLSNLKLIVLSACDTGLGDINGDEGVFGIQRALKIAGAEKIIMSLWKVPDLQTNELMTLFYTNLIEVKNVNSALIMAQSKMKLKYPPYYWAAFKLLN